ncbi:tRNA (uridine(34)/cytosine(34)/5-carboxymethylaminomethyluridine(34)-2'-O)-methyltransferase TrmL [Silvanigrella paludirubra]|uniref:Putative tRNA (cytidine(34)-2'-O)-methyltransferase n=1 Tax=Silvanigrella paludirubra TaxID=2499159 RepID=A0A6N6VY86_9BACT|nr:tRNA (cytidine(34)-2'-O)-methyltransferase [Silvanigrella paludirubra]KAB8041039.1 tRNA (uridine(34)/cytosine(34)/5-carboxymethylaminomethyluridine(34)-2'-O)-methyltransferase TrmL [Silvanigrella paludirubra]
MTQESPQNEYTGKLVYKLGESLLLQEDIILNKKPKLTFDKAGYLEPLCRNELLKFHPEVVLYCPQIPPNTGTIARMCAAFSCTLHLIEPMGFHITEKALRRAGLDYWEHVNVYLHKSWDDFILTRNKRRIIFIETGGLQSPMEFQFLPGDLLVFGAETFGIPNEIMNKEIEKKRAHKVTIPMFNRGVRSLNLSNTASIAMYVAIAKL